MINSRNTRTMKKSHWFHYTPVQLGSVCILFLKFSLEALDTILVKILRCKNLWAIFVFNPTWPNSVTDLNRLVASLKFWSLWIFQECGQVSSRGDLRLSGVQYLMKYQWQVPFLAATHVLRPFCSDIIGTE